MPLYLLAASSSVLFWGTICGRLRGGLSQGIGHVTKLQVPFSDDPSTFFRGC